MSLSARAARDLAGIEEALSASDPGLSALYTTFSQLTRDEAMPAREQLGSRRRRLIARLVLPLILVSGLIAGIVAGRIQGPARCPSGGFVHSTRTLRAVAALTCVPKAQQQGRPPGSSERPMPGVLGVPGAP